MPTPSRPLVAAPVFADPQLAACQNMARALADAGRALNTSLLPFVAQFGQAAVSLHQLVQDAYDRAGKPYGDTPEGLRRWCEEQGEAQRKAQAWDWKPLP